MANAVVLRVAALVAVLGFLSASTNAAHPVVPGFERFHDKPQLSAANAGRLLLGELNCVSCHATDGSGISAKSAPVLTNVGSRVTVEFLRSYLTSPHTVKPGATMPDVFSGKSASERKSAVEALVHFLASSGVVVQTPPDQGAVSRGEKLFHEVGCVACHGSRKPDAKPLAANVPFGKPESKYSINSLTAFLKNPHQVRPSGRMPSLLLNDKEAADIAHYFLQDIDVEPNVRFKYYEGSWQQLPDFGKLKPVLEGGATGINVSPAKRRDQFGLRFEGYFQIPKDGEYTFHLGSDDGSRLLINNKVVVDVGGVHPHTVKSGKLTLTKGPHAFVVDYFEAGGDESLTLEFEGPGIGRQQASGIVTASKVPPAAEKGFQPNDELIVEGRSLFSSAGCASCHEMQIDGKRVASTLKAKTLEALVASQGCNSATPSKAPNYSLSDAQKAAISAALDRGAPLKETPEQSILNTMTRLNCYSCHSRDKLGGPEEARNALFLTTIKEMGDEGRIPPALDGVGDKLNSTWLKHVMENGATDRPYMLTRMPKFGAENVGDIISAFAKVDLKSEVPKVAFDEPIHKVKSTARHLIGDKALSCIKCHYFDKFSSTGIQAMDLTRMTTRLRKDWFQRYLIKPSAYRPGTRMPSAWPRGQSVIPNVMNGNSRQQIAAIWEYLADGTKARTPSGLNTGKILELLAEDRPVIYRNFLEGTSARGIAVGYPEQANLAFDAEQMSIALIWQYQFMDAGRHWVGRGQGRQGPLGENIIRLESISPLAVLENAESPWPKESARQRGYRFRGYRLDKAGRPTFRYTFAGLQVDDFPKAIAGDSPSISRTISVSGNEESSVWFRVAVGGKLERKGESTIVIDNAITVRLESSSTGKLLIRESQGKQEAIVQMQLTGGSAQLVQHIAW